METVRDIYYSSNGFESRVLTNRQSCNFNNQRPLDLWRLTLRQMFVSSNLKHNLSNYYIYIQYFTTWPTQ